MTAVNTYPDRCEPPALRVVIPSLGGGGSERVAVRLLSGWARHGRSAQLIMLRGGGEWDGTIPTSVSVTCLHVQKVRYVLPRLIRTLRLNPGVPILAFGFDLAVLLGAAARVGILPGPLIFREGSLPLSNVPRRRHWLYRAMVSGASSIIAQSTAAAEQLALVGLDPQKIHIVLRTVGTRDGAAIPIRRSSWRRSPTGDFPELRERLTVCSRWRFGTARRALFRLTGIGRA